MRHEFQLAISTVFFLLLMLASLLSVHLFIKPNSLNWGHYDPNLYTLNNGFEKFFQDSCNKNHAILIGSSTLKRALLRKEASISERWRQRTLSFNDGSTSLILLSNGSANLGFLARNGNIDLRIFLPITDNLPSCPKTLILHSDVFLPNPLNNRAIEFKDYLKTSIPIIKRRLEDLWPISLQIQSVVKEKIRRQKTPCLTKQCLEKAKIINQRRFQNFNGIIIEHRMITQKLINEGAQIIILDLGRSQSLENKIQDELLFFRKSLEDFSQQDDSIKYLSFESLDDSYYDDYRHLNDKGVEIFHKWFNAKDGMGFNDNI